LGGAPPDEGALAQGALAEGALAEGALAEGALAEGALAQGGSEVQRGDWTLPVKVGGNPMWIGAIGTLLILEQGREESFSAEA